MPLSMPGIVGQDPGATSIAHTLICETWYSLLCATSPTPGRFSSADLQYLASYWVCLTAKGFCFLCVRVSVCMCMCARVCVSVCVPACIACMCVVCMCACIVCMRACVWSLIT